MAVHEVLRDVPAVLGVPLRGIVKRGYISAAVRDGGDPEDATFDTTEERRALVRALVSVRRAVARGRNARALAVNAWANMRGARGSRSLEGDTRARCCERGYGDVASFDEEDIREYFMRRIRLPSEPVCCGQLLPISHKVSVRNYIQKH